MDIPVASPSEVTVFRVADGLVQAVRFYPEPVDTGSSAVDDAIAAAVSAPTGGLSS